MKTISKRFLKSSLAVLLAVIMLFGTCVSGLAAVVDKAETSANLKGYIWYDNSLTKWTSVQVLIGHGSWSEGYQMTRIANTDMWYYNMSNQWSGATQICVFNASSKWGGEGTSPTHRSGYMDQNSAVKTFSTSYTSGLLLSGTSGSDGFTLSMNSKTSSDLNANVSANVVSAASGATNFAPDNNAGTVSVSGRYFSGNTSSTTRSASTTLGSSNTATASLGRATTVTLTASAAAGYTFLGWYNAATGGSRLSTSTSYTVTGTGSTANYYARFEKAPTYTLSYDANGGTGAPAAQTGITGAATVSSTKPTKAGHTFKEWNTAADGSGTAYQSGAAITLSANTTLYAQYTVNNYTVKFVDYDGREIKSETLKYGASVTAPASPTRVGYTFDSWDPSVSTTVTGNATYTATYTKNNYTVSFAQEGGTGTVSATPSSATMGDSVAISVTPQDGYKIGSITGNCIDQSTGNALNVGECDSFSGTITVPSENVVIHVNYVKAGTCAPHFQWGDQELNLGATFTNPASTNQYCTAGGTFTYSSNNTEVASVNANGMVTAKKPGTATITATCACGTKATYLVTVNAPEIDVLDEAIDVNETWEIDLDEILVTDGPDEGFSYEFSTAATGITVSDTGVVNAYVPGIYTVYCDMVYGDNVVATDEFLVEVNEPLFSLNPRIINLLVGQVEENAFQVKTDANVDYELTSNDDSIATISGNTLEATGAGLATITATFHYNALYNPVATAEVQVDTPSIKASPTSVALEYGEGSPNASKTVTLTTNAADGNGTGDDITVVSANENIATATVADGVVTITAKAAGSTTVTATFHGQTVEIPVTVTTYDPYEYIYVTDNHGWTNMYAYCWEGGYSTAESIQMIYIGRNEQDQRIFALRLNKNKLPNKIIFKSKSDWSGSQTEDCTFNVATQNAWWIGNQKSDGKYTADANRWNLDITLPTVSVPDVAVSVVGTASVTATVTGGSSYSWSTADTTKATVSGTTTTATVTGKATGETDLTIRAFIPTPTGWKSLATDQSTAYPYISAAATSKVTVANVYYDVTTSVATSIDGTTYDSENTEGGTATITYNGETTTAASVAHGEHVTVTATPADGYRFVCWYKKGTQDGDSATKSTVAITEAMNYEARFVKTYQVTVDVPADQFESVTYNGVEITAGETYTVDAGADVTVSATAKDGFMFSHWDISTEDGPVYQNSTTIDVDGNVTLTPVAVATNTAAADAYTNRVAIADGGTVTVNGSYEPVELVNGTTATFVAQTNANYTFCGWYSDTTFETLVSADETYSVVINDDSVHLYALFAKNYVVMDFANGVEAFTFEYDVASDTYTTDYDEFVSPITVKNTVDATSKSDASVIVNSSNMTGISGIGGHQTAQYILTADTENYDTTKPVLYKLEANGDGTYNMVIELTPAQKYTIYLDEDGALTSVAEKAANVNVELPITPPEGMYLENAIPTDVDGNVIDNIDFGVANNVATFKMPAMDIILTPIYNDYRYITFTDETGLEIDGLKAAYEHGEAVNITVSPATEATAIMNLSSDNAAIQITNNGDGTWTISGNMPADSDVTITPTVDANFAVKSEQVAIGNYGTGVTKFGTVTMTDSAGNTIAEGSYVKPGAAVTYTATPDANYTFVGFYSDYACDQPIAVSQNETAVTVSADTTVYALFARKQWIAYDFSNTTTNFEMAYDPTIGAYTHTATLASGDSTSTEIAKGAWFAVTNDLNGWNDTASYRQYDASQFTVNFNQKGYGATIGWDTQGQKAWVLSTAGETGAQIKFILTPDGNTAIDISATTEKEGATIYLSSGTLTMPGTMNPTSVFTPAIAGSTTKTTTNDPDGKVVNIETYTKANINTAQTITFETTLDGADAANYYIDSYVVYDLKDKTFEIITPNTLGNNKYSGSVYVDSDCYIVPIYMHTEEWLAANNMVAIDVYFDATAIKDTAWGPFVAAYAYSPNEAFFGEWPGQLMIPTEDGTSFYGQFEVPAAGSENAAQGVLFNNYIFKNCVSENAAAFGVGTMNNQTYDYREAMTIYESGYDVITFVSKSSDDGYHGDKAANQAVTKPVSTTTNAKTGGYIYEYLVARDGVTPMDLTGQNIENATLVDDCSNADYYVITKGDVTYVQGGYTADPNFKGDWCVDWYIFDKDGNYLGKTLSDGMWNDYNDNGNSVLAEALGLTNEDLEGKLVAISYEAPNNDSHQLSFDGQWYGNTLDQDVNAKVMVGLQDENGNFVIDTEDPTNDAIYGDGWLVAEEDRAEEGYVVGEKYAELPISLDHGSVSLNANTKDNYRFVGWYTESNGKYTQISNAFNYNTYINLDTTYYAIFREISEGEVVVNHMVYDNPDDPVIPSHGGVSTMTVEVRNSAGEVIASGTPATDRTTAAFEATEGVYTITITTTPLMNGKFFAWYGDAVDANGNATYEEIGTDGSNIGQTTTQTLTFEYEFTQDSPRRINLYSDVTRVSNKTNLYYRYLNRHNEWRTYTVKDILLTDEECMGYEGNEYNAYYPTYITKWEYTDGTSSYGDKAEAGKTVMGSYNAVTMNAPNDDVTEAFDQEITWVIDDAHIDVQGSHVMLTAQQDHLVYTITCELPEQTIIKEGIYNTLIDDIEAPATDSNGTPFSHWEEVNEDGSVEFLSYQRNYYYRIVENKTIRAVYSDDAADAWTPSIDSVTITREFSDKGDFIYTDFLLAYNSKAGYKLNDVKASMGINYGLIMVQDPTSSYTGEGDTLNFPTPTEEELKKSAAALKNGLINGKRFYNFVLTDKTLTNFNRCDYYLNYDNDDEKNNYKSVEFTCVAYIIVDGVVYLSAPQYVNFYKEATAPIGEN